MTADIQNKITGLNIFKKEIDLADIVAGRDVRRVEILQPDRPSAGNITQSVPAILNGFATITVPELLRTDDGALISRPVRNLFQDAKHFLVRRR